MLLSVVLLALALTAAVDGGSLVYKAGQANAVIPWAEKTPAQPVDESARAGDIVCPDRRSTCPNRYTCCQTIPGTWTCCPYVNAVCCSDRTHCCPQGYDCNVQQGTCIKGVVVPATKRPEVEPTSAAPSYGLVNAGTACPGGGSCPSHGACCRTYGNTYNCCNYPLNVCCDNGLHCCPHGSICQQPTLTCITVDEASVQPLEILRPAAGSDDEFQLHRG